jgi:hypothetical protein
MSCISYGDLIRRKNGVTYLDWFNETGKEGTFFAAGTVEFPDGIKLCGFSYQRGWLDDGSRGVKHTAGSIAYPDGRRVENPSDEEIVPCFQRMGTRPRSKLLRSMTCAPRRHLRSQLAARARGAASPPSLA